MNFIEWTPEYCNSNETGCMEILEDLQNWKEIPFINHIPLNELSDLGLVRFRGMIQDMSDPEMYLERYDVLTADGRRIQNGKYRDCLAISANENVDFDSTSNKHGERRTLFVVSLPGINKWAQEIENEVAKSTSVILKQNRVHGKKRIFDKMEMEVDDIVENGKQLRTECGSRKSTPSNAPVLSTEYLLNSPIAERPGKACMVKIYSDLEGNVLNSIVDVVGFLSVNPALDGSHDEPTEFQDASEIQAANPPPSLIPRLHAVKIRKLNHANPLLDASLIEPCNDMNIEAVHKDLHITLTQCLFGDDLAASYLLSHLISTVYVRTQMETLGQFGLNLCNIPGEVLPDYTSTLYEIIESLIPVSHYFPMTLDNMNTQQFIPKKDYTTNKLVSGILQLASHTHLVLDETRLQPGKLEANGIEGVRNLSYLIKSQLIKCNFQYYEIDFHANIPVLILSEGKSMLPTDCHVPLNPDPDAIKLITETLKAAKHYLHPKLNAIRKYLTLSKMREFSMNPEESSMIERDFVEMRKNDNKVGASDLHSLLILSRLLAISMGKNSLDKESWEKAKALEIERQKRI